MWFKIPNVVVFLNHFRIISAGLMDITIQVWKTQHGNKTFESNRKKENDVDDECNEDNDQYIIVYICLNCILEYKKKHKT